MTFSERMGLTEARTALQVDDMDEALRNSIWNILDMLVWTPNFGVDQYGRIRGNHNGVSRFIWAEFFKLPVDSRPSRPKDVLARIRTSYGDLAWYEVYDFVEFMIAKYRTDITTPMNLTLERELSGYRIINGLCTPVTSLSEIEAIQEAMNDTPYNGVRRHLETALKHLSQRDNPDYRGSIRESTHAVESLCKEIIGNEKATLGQALNELEKQEKVHGALKTGMSAFYGYASDEQGIRHAMLDEPNISADKAKFFLVACSAFINYMISKSS